VVFFWGAVGQLAGSDGLQLLEALVGGKSSGDMKKGRVGLRRGV